MFVGHLHHVIKDHPYRSLAARLRLSNCRPLVIGLTASLTYAVGEAKVRAASQALCAELQISRIEVASEAELRDGGYTGSSTGTVAEVRQGVQLAQGVIPACNRKPHLMHSAFFQRIANATATVFSLELLRCVRALEGDVLAADPGFKSPLASASLKSWGVYAHNRVSRSPLYRPLEAWYEATRIVVTSWEEGEDLATMFLIMTLPNAAADPPPSAPAADFRCSPATAALWSLFFTRPPAFERFEDILQVLREKLDAPGAFRGILFVRQRVTTHILERFIRKSDLGLLGHLRPVIVYSAASPATPSLSLTSAQGVAALKAFGEGSCNLLIATSVAEEGVDVPEANCVIYFDPIDTSVSYVQGRGRARQADSSFVMMKERADRPAALLAQMEMEQHRVAANFQPQQSGAVKDAARLAQHNRERGALSSLAGAVSEDTSVAALNTFCKKTKALCEETYTTALVIRCTLQYESVLRRVSGHGEADTKKRAKKRAALSLAQRLHAELKNSTL
jgi:hypothetical protein